MSLFREYLFVSKQINCDVPQSLVRLIQVTTTLLHYYITIATTTTTASSLKDDFVKLRKANKKTDERTLHVRMVLARIYGATTTTATLLLTHLLLHY